MPNMVKDLASSIISAIGGVSRADLSEVGVNPEELAQRTEGHSDRLANASVKLTTLATANMAQANETLKKTVTIAEAKRDAVVAVEELNLGKADRQMVRSKRLAQIAKRIT